MRRLAIVTLFALTLCPVVAGSLKLAKVSAPAINCKFDPQCQTTAQDLTANIGLPGSKTKGFLQSRALKVGQPGTAAAGMYGYLYRVDLTGLVLPNSAKSCVAAFSIDFGAVKSIDYDSDGSPDQVFVITTGGLGSVAPASASQTGNAITFTFASHPCTGTALAKGESSFFFGLVSQQTSTTSTAKLKTTSSAILTLDALTPLPPPPPQSTWKKK